MISKFKMNGQFVAQSTAFTCALPIGSLIPSPVRLSDPDPLKSQLRIMAVYPNLKTGDFDYDVDSAA